DAPGERPRSGRKRKVDSELLPWLYEGITQHDPRQYQFPFCLWTLRLVRTLLTRKFEPATTDLQKLQARPEEDEGISGGNLSRTAGESAAHGGGDLLCG